jgi:sugar phosphate isomerase/epimerase
MKISQVAAQLYTLRDYTKTPEDIAKTFEKVRAIGYEAVQCSALGPIEDAALLQLAKDNGLKICATHEGLAPVLENPEAIIEHLQNLECPHSAIGFPSGVDLGSYEGVLDFARKFDVAAKKFADAGLSMGHHNHHHEFRKVNGKTVLDVILENTQYVTFELDTYWVQHGGANPVSWARKVAGRAPLIHLKDYGVSNEDKPQYVEVGNGNLEFAEIIKAAEESGTEWFIVEQDTTPGDPFDSLKISFDYIKANLVS